MKNINYVMPQALIELRTSFDGYELLRSNDEVEETVSSQFISGLRMFMGLQFAAGKFGEFGALAFYKVNARKQFFSIELFIEMGETVGPSVEIRLVYLVDISCKDNFCTFSGSGYNCFYFMRCKVLSLINYKEYL